jgi:MFS family permease
MYRVKVQSGLARALRHDPSGRARWWASPEPLDARAGAVLGSLAALSSVVGYHGALLAQTMTFAADEFGADRTAQGAVLSVVRTGSLLAFALTAAADRRGRRSLLTVCVLGCITSTSLGVITPNLAGLAAIQIVHRGAWAAALALLGIVVAEEMPAGARAYATGVVTVAGALGAGIAVALLPVADTADGAWRALYAAPLLSLPIVVRTCRALPETRRFTLGPSAQPMREHRARVGLLCLVFFHVNVFMAPASQFRNEFLRTERGFGAAGISLFVLVTALPGVVGLVVGGRLADSWGRRVIGTWGLVAATASTAASFVLVGPPMWIAAVVAVAVGAAVTPSLAVYRAELFPTSLRGRANAHITVAAALGSVGGLLAVGRLADAFGSFAPALALATLAPAVVALLVALRFPETAGRELDDINPGDARPVTGRASDGTHAVG